MEIIRDTDCDIINSELNNLIKKLSEKNVEVVLYDLPNISPNINDRFNDFMYFYKLNISKINIFVLNQNCAIEFEIYMTNSIGGCLIQNKQELISHFSKSRAYKKYPVFIDNLKASSMFDNLYFITVYNGIECDDRIIAYIAHKLGNINKTIIYTNDDYSRAQHNNPTSVDIRVYKEAGIPYEGTIFENYLARFFDVARIYHRRENKYVERTNFYAYNICPHIKLNELYKLMNMTDKYDPEYIDTLNRLNIYPYEPNPFVLMQEKIEHDKKIAQLKQTNDENKIKNDANELNYYMDVSTDMEIDNEQQYNSDNMEIDEQQYYDDKMEIANDEQLLEINSKKRQIDENDENNEFIKSNKSSKIDEYYKNKYIKYKIKYLALKNIKKN